MRLGVARSGGIGRDKRRGWSHPPAGCWESAREGVVKLQSHEILDADWGCVGIIADRSAATRITCKRVHRLPQSQSTVQRTRRLLAARWQHHALEYEQDG